MDNPSPATPHEWQTFPLLFAGATLAVELVCVRCGVVRHFRLDEHAVGDKRRVPIDRVDVSGDCPGTQ